MNDLQKNLVTAAQCVISIDLEHKSDTIRISDDTVRISGNSESEKTISEVKRLTKYAKTLMVIDDCAHTRMNVLNNLANYGPLVTKGCYYIVEDTIISNGLFKEYDKDGTDNPLCAIEQFIKENDSFEIDRTREKFFITACPKGFLRRVK